MELGERVAEMHMLTWRLAITWWPAGSSSIRAAQWTGHTITDQQDSRGTLYACICGTIDVKQNILSLATLLLGASVLLLFTLHACRQQARTCQMSIYHVVRTFCIFSVLLLFLLCHMSFMVMKLGIKLWETLSFFHLERPSSLIYT